MLREAGLVDVRQEAQRRIYSLRPVGLVEVARLTAEGSRTRLVVEERGVPLAQLPFYAAGWQVHVEDLRRCLVSGGPVHADGWSGQAAAPAWQSRWAELTPAYQRSFESTAASGNRT